MTTRTKLTAKWTTICTTGYSHSVNPYNENRSAHGGVCHHQARVNASGETIGRKVNSNGRHKEVGKAFPLTAAQLEHWESIERSSR